MSDGPVRIHAGDCTEVMVQMREAGDLFDAAVMDPPYHLASIVERYGSENAAPTKAGETGVYVRGARGFMGQTWDGGDLAFRPETWRLVYDLLKPGAHLVAFGATKNYHRLAVAIEDAGFEIRDMLDWAYGSGFPKNHDMSKAIDRHLGVSDERPVVGTERISNDIRGGGLLDAKHGARPGFVRKITTSASDEAKQWEGWGTALKPCKEPIVLAQKPISERSIAANVLKWGTGALNLAACRIPGVDEEHRYPGNLVHDGSPEMELCFPDGSHRYFYTAKASKYDRLATSHPTVKPVELMRWLCRLVTPPGGRILDAFAGTGTTGAAALIERFRCDLIELKPAYLADIERRFAFMRGEGRHALAERMKLDDPEIAAKASGSDLPLFE